MTRIERCKEWEPRIAAFQSSGQNLSAWCATHDLKVHQLQYWLRKQRLGESQPADKPAQWLSLEIKDTATESKDLPLLVKVGTTTIEVYPGFNAELLLDVVRTLSATC